MTQLDHRSFFLVIEGLDGAGKSEVSRRLLRLLRQTLGDDVKLTFEPHDPSAGGLFIRQVLAKRVRVSARTQALAFALNRADHHERVIAPFLNAGLKRLLLCDRYYLSSLVYQSTSEQPMEVVMELNASARRPDLTLFLDASTETCYARMGARRADRELFEQNLGEMRRKYDAGIEFLRRRGETVITVNADPSLLDVLNSIIDILNAQGPDWLKLSRLSELEAHTSKPEFSVDTANGQASEASNRLLIAYLRDNGYTLGDRLLWEEIPAYKLEYTLPLGILQRGALLLCNGERYDLITRKLQEIDQQTDRLFDFFVVFDPSIDRGGDYERERLSRLSASVRVLGRRDLAELTQKK
jgi:dTMP kinase